MLVTVPGDTARAEASWPVVARGLFSVKQILKIALT